jgi:sulfur relay (sulfurtransferase) complex TusBCD TusD component (DsrE family)
MARYLSVVEEPYRATIEEQDDTAVWFTHALRNAGAEVTLLLRGDAVAYAAPGQDARGLRFGAREEKMAPEIDHDLAALMARGVTVYAVTEDATDRGLSEGGLAAGIEHVSRAHLARLFADHDRVLHW